MHMFCLTKADLGEIEAPIVALAERQVKLTGKGPAYLYVDDADHMAKFFERTLAPYGLIKVKQGLTHVFLRVLESLPDSMKDFKRDFAGELSVAFYVGEGKERFIPNPRILRQRIDAVFNKWKDIIHPVKEERFFTERTFQVDPAPTP